jgi:hypothetical protein
MEYPNPKIKFYKVRTLSERLSVAFEFLRENWKPLLKFSFYLILPICLFQAFAMNSIMRYTFSMGFEDAAGTSGDLPFAFFRNYVLLMIFIFVGTGVINALIYSLMTEYERRDSRLMSSALADFKSLLIKNTGKLLRIFLFLFGVVVLISGFILLFAWISPWTLILTGLVSVISLVAVIVPVSLFTPVYLFEDIPFFEALKKAFRYGFSAWGETFVLILIFGFLANIISGVTMLPWYLVILFGEIFTLFEPGAGINTTIWYQFISYLLGIIQSYGMYVSYFLSAVGIAFQYFHLREKNEGISVDESIRNFDRL